MCMRVGSLQEGKQDFGAIGAAMAVSLCVYVCARARV
jgi:hypothetical protein